MDGGIASLNNNIIRWWPIAVTLARLRTFKTREINMKKKIDNYGGNFSWIISCC